MEYILREWKSEDYKSIAKYANNKKIAYNLRDGFPFPYSEEDAKGFIDSVLTDRTHFMRAVEIDGQAAGSIGIFFKNDVYRLSAELGYWLAEPYWGQGVITAAVSETCAYVFSNYNIIRIFAEPFARNTASRKVLENAGFTLEGVLEKSIIKNGRVEDSCIYALINRNKA